MALRSVSPSLSVSVLSVCRGRGISLGWRLPALQILCEVEGKIKPSSRCQEGCRLRHMEMIYGVVIVSHFNSRFWFESESCSFLHGMNCSNQRCCPQDKMCLYFSFIQHGLCEFYNLSYRKEFSIRSIFSLYKSTGKWWKGFTRLNQIKYFLFLVK